VLGVQVVRPSRAIEDARTRRLAEVVAVEFLPGRGQQMSDLVVDQLFKLVTGQMRLGRRINGDETHPKKAKEDLSMDAIAPVPEIVSTQESWRVAPSAGSSGGMRGLPSDPAMDGDLASEEETDASIFTES
jgi:hypothetical protein